MVASSPKTNSFYTLVYACVRRIPSGHVATYGDIATWLSSPRAARAVGYALAASMPSGVPWHRVINRLGEISMGGQIWRPEEQLARLRQEGVDFDAEGRCLLDRYRFKPTSAQRRRWALQGEQLQALRKC
jgi:methylated-DNA-protein-cysteine methyltransferase-like protein